MKWIVLPGTKIISDEGGAFNGLEDVTHPETQQPMNWTHQTVNHSGQIGKNGMS